MNPWLRRTGGGSRNSQRQGDRTNSICPMGTTGIGGDWGLREAKQISVEKGATLFLTEKICRVQKIYKSYEWHLQYSTEWKHAMNFLQIFWTNCVIVADWVNKTDRIPSLEILKRKVLSNVVSLSFEKEKQHYRNIKEQSVFKCCFPFLPHAPSHPGEGIRRLLSSYRSAQKQFHNILGNF